MHKVASNIQKSLPQYQTVNQLISSQTTYKNTSKLQYLDAQTVVCTKYNNCIQQKKQSKQNRKNVQNQSFDSQFEIPSQILQQEQPVNILVLPTVQYLNSYQTDKLIQKKLQQKKAQLQQQKKIQKQYQNQFNTLKNNLKQKTKKIIKQCNKIPLDQQKRPQWNHTIFGEKSKQEQKKIQQQLNKQRQIHQKRSLNKKKVELKDCKQRIKQYKQKQKRNILQQQRSKNCQHHHSHSSLLKDRYKNNQRFIEQEDNQEVCKINFEKNANQILCKMKQDKLRQIQHRKIIKGKIKAIQISSRQMVKKGKTKPLDSSKQFILDLNQRGQKKHDQKISQIKQKQNLKNKQQNSKIQNYRNSINSKKNVKSSKIKKNQQISSQSQKLKQTNPENIKIQTNSNQRQFNKFFLWDVPIYKQDYQTINLEKNITYQPVKKSTKPNSFRNQVNQYLEQKFHKRMKQEIQEVKRDKIQKQIEEKKQQFLVQYDQFSNYNSPAYQIFWNEDQVYKINSRTNYQHI